MSLKTTSLYLNLAFVLYFIVAFFFSPRQARQIEPANQTAIVALQHTIQALRKQARQDSTTKMHYIRLADSLRIVRLPIQHIIIKQNEKIDSIRRLPAVLPDTALLRIFTGFKTSHER